MNFSSKYYDRYKCLCMYLKMFLKQGKRMCMYMFEYIKFQYDSWHKVPVKISKITNAFYLMVF